MTNRDIPVWVIAFVGVVTVPLYLSMPPNHDVAWHIYAASRLMEGATLYDEIVEFNMPAAYYIYFPISLLEDLLVDEHTTSVIYFIVLQIILLLLSWLAVRRISHARSRNFCTLFLVSFFLVQFLAGAAFGQRDQLLISMFAPWMTERMVLILSSAGDSSRPTWRRCLGGILVATAIAIKPHYLLLYVTCELFSCVRLGSAKTIFSLESATVALTLLLLASEFVLLHGEAFLRIGRYAALALPHYRKADFPVPDVASFDVYLLALLMAAHFLTRRYRQARRGDHTWDTGLAFIACAFFGCLLAYLAQGKGFTYHLWPARAVGFAGSLLWLTGGKAFDDGTGPPAPHLPRRLMWWPTLGVASWIPMLFPLAIASSDVARNSRGLFLEHAVRELSDEVDAHSFVLLSTSIMPAFPIVNRTGLSWGSRFPYLWLLPPLLNDAGEDPGDTSPVRAELGQYLQGSLTSDLARFRPEIVAVERSANKQAIEDEDTDLLAFLRRDPRFEHEWRHYRLVRTVNTPADQPHLFQRSYAMYVRTDDAHDRP